MTVLLLLLLLACCCSGCAAFYLPDSEKKETWFGATLSPILYIQFVRKVSLWTASTGFGSRFFFFIFFSYFIRIYKHTQITWFRSFEFAFCVPDRVSFVYTFSAYISQCGGLNSICAFDSFVCVCVCACVNSVALGISSSDSCSKYFFSLKS